MKANDPKHQGKFHLLIIVFIPLMAICVFLAPWYVLLMVAMSAVIAGYLIFRK